MYALHTTVESNCLDQQWLMKRSAKSDLEKRCLLNPVTLLGHQDKRPTWDTYKMVLCMENRVIFLGFGCIMVTWPGSSGRTRVGEGISMPALPTECRLGLQPFPPVLAVVISPLWAQVFSWCQPASQQPSQDHLHKEHPRATTELFIHRPWYDQRASDLARSVGVGEIETVLPR